MVILSRSRPVLMACSGGSHPNIDVWQRTGMSECGTSTNKKLLLIFMRKAIAGLAAP